MDQVSLGQGLASGRMGIFSRKPRSPLPPDIAAQMEERGRVRSEGFTSELTKTQDQHFLGLSQEEKEAYVDALADTILPLGGWAVLGAADLLVKAVFEPDDRPSYVSVLLAALELKRAVRVSDIALSVYESELFRPRVRLSVRLQLPVLVNSATIRVSRIPFGDRAQPRN